jgi:eukaryotic-like serine/threonine-protein kinase
MGEVYRATDNNLKRAVAIKVPPASVAADAERLARFQREAEVLAAFSHPNIAAIYGLERTGATTALVMELVERPTLADRIAQGPMPVDEALPIAKQTAGALEAAHELNIIHRDLKPANIKVRPDGTVKVLDFGLAKAMEPTGALSPSMSRSPAITTPAMTQAGMILGTAAYMSPEQAKGRAVDRRSDVWAFGAVLFEMLTGQRAFAGEDVSDTLANVLKMEPDWERLPANVPPRVRQVIRACLHKNAKQRIGDVQDVRLALEGAFETLVPDGGVMTGPRRTERLVWLSTVAVVMLLAAVQSARVWRQASSMPSPQMRLEIAMPSAPAATIAENELESLAISPDGLKMVFVSVSQGRSQLWLRSLDSVSARPLAGTDLAILPFWAPDSRSVAFFANGQLKRIDIDGGSTQTLARAPFGLGGTWNRDGTILLTPLLSGPIYRIPATGGEPAALTQLAPGQIVHYRPRFLPDGRHFFYYAEGSPDVSGVYVGQLDGAETRRLLDAESALIHQSSGHVLFVSQGTLYAQPFDFKGLALIGNRSPVAEDVAAVSVSDTGLVAYRRGSLGERRQFIWFDRSGREIGRVGDSYNSYGNGHPSLSPNGRYVAVVRVVDGNADIWLLETTRGVLSRFTSESALNFSPKWSPDGHEIVFNSDRSGIFDLYLKSMASPGGDELLLATPQNKSVTDWSLDGRFILFRSVDPALSHDLWALPL